MLNAFGLFWRRNEIEWSQTTVKLLGVQLAGSAAVDFSAQAGVLKALLIEALEPPQNRRQGDGFAELEYLQQIDPNTERKRKRALLTELGESLK